MLKRLFTTGLSAVCLLLPGCSELPQHQDIRTLQLALRGRTTHKQNVLLFERTTYESLVRRGEYLVRWRRETDYHAAKAREGQTVEGAVTETAKPGTDPPTLYLLVRGIGKAERILSGEIGGGGADPGVVGGDLLLLDPPPNHRLFREAEVLTAKAGRTRKTGGSVSSSGVKMEGDQRFLLRLGRRAAMDPLPASNPTR